MLLCGDAVMSLCCDPIVDGVEMQMHVFDESECAQTKTLHHSLALIAWRQPKTIADARRLGCMESTRLHDSEHDATP
jgi:hypothetical protein